MIIYLLIAFAVALIVLWAFGTDWLFLCRSSLFGLLVLCLLPLLALSIAKGLLIGVFDLENGLAAIEVGLLLFFASWAVTSTSDLVLDLASVRLGQTVPAFGKYLRPTRGALIVAAILLNLAAIINSVEVKHTWKVVAGLGMGIMIGFVLFLFFQLVRDFYHQRKSSLTDLGRRILQKRPTELPNAEAERTNPTRGFVIYFLGCKITVPAWLGRGYLQQSGEYATLVPGHWQSALALVAMLLVYWILSLLKPPIPALGSLLLLVTIFIWLLSGVAFFLDAYRIPVFISLFAFIWLSSLVNKSDHFYRIWSAPPVERLEAADVLSQPTNDEKPVILVAAAGGGIQAAAWTARVLVGLEEELDGGNPGAFAESVRLLSGVSGGSTGIMFYVHETYPLSSSTSAGELHTRIFRAAKASSLDPAVFGLAYYDLQRFLLPSLVQHIYRDRAQALETAWIENEAAQDKNSSGRSLKDATLNGWSRDLVEHQRPAVIFNSTIVETGERLSFSTSRCETLAESQRDFSLTYHDKDIRIPTAVRLSATFPVVSPAARPAVGETSTADDAPTDQKDIARWHLVDGGYFDTSGLTALSTWLDDALKKLVKDAPEKVPRKILIVQILPFPQPSPPDGSKQESSESTTEVTSSGKVTFAHILAPLQALFSVRDHIQVGMANATFYSVAKRWQLEAYNPCSPGIGKLSPIDIRLFTVGFTSVRKEGDTPLSWHLRQTEQKAIDESWEAFRHSQTMRDIEGFFNQKQASAQCP
jgi:hypothetical protein